MHGRDQGCQGKGGKELNRGLGATSEEMVGGRRIGEDQDLESGVRGEEDEDEDADEDADQENEEEEVTESRRRRRRRRRKRQSGVIYALSNEGLYVLPLFICSVYYLEP